MYANLWVHPTLQYHQLGYQLFAGVIQMFARQGLKPNVIRLSCKKFTNIILEIIRAKILIV